ncbi:MAG: YciI family protein [Acinetobacter sp.]
MPYVIETWDKIDHLPLRKKLRDEHLKYLNQKLELLLACGAKLADDGSDLGGGIYIIDVNTRKAAQQFIEQDPFYIGGLFQKIKIDRWRKAYFNGISCL